MEIAARIESIFEDRLKTLAKELQYSETDVKTLLAVNKRLSNSPHSGKQRDPTLPKAPPNGYMRYCQEMRKRIQEENPELSNSEIMKLLGEQWKEEPQSVKDRYNNQFKKEKEKYTLHVKALKEQKSKTNIEDDDEVKEVKSDDEIKSEDEIKEVKIDKKKNSLSTLPSIRKLNPNV